MFIQCINSVLTVLRQCINSVQTVFIQCINSVYKCITVYKHCIISVKPLYKPKLCIIAYKTCKNWDKMVYKTLYKQCITDYTLFIHLYTLCRYCIYTDNSLFIDRHLYTDNTLFIIVYTQVRHL